MLTVVETLQDLVRIPSVNPMGRDLSGPEFLESRMTDHLEYLFGRLGLPHERQEVAELRSNIIARLDGSTTPENGGELLMFEAHQDTVPVDGMTIEPWSGNLRDGRVYGRGACDIKGGMACMLAAISRLAEQRPGGMPTIVMACSVNEEHGYSGATELAKLWSSGQSAILPRRPDAIVVAEPTMLDVVVAHKGVVRWKCRTHGRACHSSQPELGDNAIYRMSRVIAALEKYAREVCPTLGRHPLLQTPTLSIGTIVGGISVNTVPDESSIEIDRRLLPDENPEEAYRHIVEYVSRETKSDPNVSHDAPFISASGLPDGGNDQLAEQLLRVARELQGRSDRIGVAFGTDAAAFASAGAPTVVFGPGSIDQAHTADEWIETEQLELATDILFQFGKGGSRGK